MSKIRVIGGFCKNGHLLDEENSAVHQGRYIVCRRCRKDYCKANWEKHKNDPVFQAKMQNSREQWRQNNPERKKERELLRDYKMPLETFKNILLEQDNKCPICGDEMLKPHVDHDHGCCPKKHDCCGKCVRGVICHNCNLMLGRLKDREDIFYAAALYLRQYKERREAEK